MRWRNILIILILSLIPPSLMLYIGISHNAMMEFCRYDPELSGDCILDIKYAAVFFLSGIFYHL